MYKYDKDKLKNSINNADDETLSKGYKELLKAEKSYKNGSGTNIYKNSYDYGHRLLAFSMKYPEFKRNFENVIKEKGIDISKSLFDFMDIYDIEEEEFVDNDYMDYDATQPELFNTISYKVAEAIKCCCKNR